MIIYTPLFPTCCNFALVVLNEPSIAFISATFSFGKSTNSPLAALLTVQIHRPEDDYYCLAIFIVFLPQYLASI